MELALRRLEGVDKVSISIPKQTFSVTLKPGASFPPAEIREAVAQSHVKVLRFHIDAKGQVETQGSQQFFVAGKNRFLVKNGANLPTGVPLSIQGTVNDAADPPELEITESKPAGQ